jgi:tetratricopeptide (TPR) repeat protein
MTPRRLLALGPAWAFALLLVAAPPLIAGDAARIWEEPLELPTYLVDPPGRNPRFYDGRAYQGAQGRVYPYPIFESLSSTRVTRPYDMVYLENGYIRVAVLPEIGGRVFGARDKTNGYDFVYRQHVIKPGLIGMLGAWISGGIEWNFPHHHRATAFMPVDYALQENPDGSVTLWIGELEIRHRMKFMLGISVYPGRSYFEVTFRPFNRTPFPHSFLYFANTGVHTNEDYQVLFPPSTEYGTYHGKNQFVEWPIAHEVYNRVDYTKGVDISWWKNHPEWTSIFAWNYEDDFVGGYDHGKEAGTLLYSNHHIGPGKKFWTWSTGPRGQLWDEALTETDGPELELMIGGFSDNQPDYSWLQPSESKLLRQYWYPIRELGGVKNANLDAAVNLEVTPEGAARFGFNTTSARPGARVILRAGEHTVFEKTIDIDPATPFTAEVALPPGTGEYDLRLSLEAASGEELVAYQPRPKKGSPRPEPVTPPPPPEKIETAEELYLAGMRLEQFYNPALTPLPYYEEALRRDPGKSRVHVALGIASLRQGRYEAAERHLRAAVDRVTRNHTSPRDGEPLYYLGLALRFEGRLREAYDALYKATWSAAFHSAAYYQLAEIDCRRGDFETALAHLDRSLSTNTANAKARNLKAAVLRQLGRVEEAGGIAADTLATDLLDFWAANEVLLAQEAQGRADEAAATRRTLHQRMRDQPQSYLELALDYGNSGLWEDAIDVLSRLAGAEGVPGASHPMLQYYLGFYREKQGDTVRAHAHYERAASRPSDYCFPFRLESIDVLRSAMEANPGDARAPYYLGNLLYEKQPEAAIESWERARALDDSFALVHRNLGWAYDRTEHDRGKAIASYEKAIALDPDDPRLYYELDVLYDAARVDPEKRLALLEAHHDVLHDNNVSDALAREVLLLALVGRYDDALEVIGQSNFRQWEGISKAYATFVDAHLLRGLDHYGAGRFREALLDFEAALEFPKNIHEARPYSGGRRGEVWYFVGTAHEALGDLEEARGSYEKAVEHRQRVELSEAWFYRGLALGKLGREAEAREIFDALVALGEERMKGSATDFFAKFGERETQEDRLAAAHYLLGLGRLGQGETRQAREAFARAVELNPNHLWAIRKLSELE